MSKLTDEELEYLATFGYVGEKAVKVIKDLESQLTRIRANFFKEHKPPEQKKLPTLDQISNNRLTAIFGTGKKKGKNDSKARRRKGKKG